MALTPIGCTMFLASNSGATTYLDYGALGLCAFMVAWMCWHNSQLAASNDRKDKILGELNAKNTAAYNRLANLLEDRPCLFKDNRIKDDIENNKI